MKNRDILISGASVAGPALAYWLRRYGFNPTIVERAPAPRDGGQAIDIRGTARVAAERMGILDDIRRAHTGAHGMSFVNSSGKRVASMGADLLGDSGGMIADIEILRGDLVHILHAATRDHVEYIFGDSITAISQGESSVTATFERSQPRTFDLVIGADGLHSNVRSLAFGEESRFVHHLGAYVSIFPTANMLNLDGWELMYTVPGKTAGIYPIRGGTAANAMFFFASPPLHYDRHDTAQQKHILAQTFAGMGWEVSRLLAAMWDAPTFYFDAASQIHMDHWSSGRVALLGDSAYCASPLSGQGTSLALVGAYVLAGELAVSAGDHPAAFARYEHEMRAYVKAAQKFATGASSFLTPRSPLQIGLRNQMLRMLPYMPWRGAIAGSAQKLASTVTLKDYQSALSGAHPSLTR